MKAVLVSVQPKWCELIASGKKTIEVRKTRPKLEAPFKCYIYCTQKFDRSGDGYFQGKYCGKVIGEFMCDKIEDMRDVEREPTCLTINEWLKYTDGHKGIVWGWHISDLVIYDKPKELSEFYKYTEYDDSRKDKRPCAWCDYNQFDYSENHEYCSIDYDGEHCIHLQIKKPPQSWCYVEEVE